MSYAIEYNRQFIRSEQGITPCWLAGDNNVTECTFRGRERRVRNWSVFYNLLAVTEDDILNAIQHSLHGYNEHWKTKNGKWIDDAALIRWIKNGCKNAATVEEILAVNRKTIRGIDCHVSVWSKDLENKRILSKTVFTTEEFDTWIREVKAAQAACTEPGTHFYPIVDFVTEELIHPGTKTEKHPDKVIFCNRSQRFRGYLKEFSDTHCQWTDNIKEALVCSYDEAVHVMATSPFEQVRKARLAPAEMKEQPFNVVLKFVNGPRSGQFIARRAKGCIYTAYSVSGAKRFRDEKQANAAMAKIQPLVKERCGELAVCIIEEQGEKT